MELRHAALLALQIANPKDKCAAVLELSSTPFPSGPFPSGPLTLDTRTQHVEPPDLPGRPDQPELVPPTQVKQRSVQSTAGRAALVHSLAHIELNAVNLALDIVWRFPGLPASFYTDWLGVAQDEARHFGLLQRHLESLGYHYGDFPAHNGLWDMAEKTRTDLLARLALVPRTLEARGLDMSPLIRDKLKQAGDGAGAAILDVILNDEIGHVAIGNRWYRWLCEQRQLDPIAAYAAMALHYQAPKQRGPFNTAARLAAGFTPEEMEALVKG